MPAQKERKPTKHVSITPVPQGAPMPKFYFHLMDGEHTEKDDIGADLPDVDAACAEARKFIEEIRSDLDQPDRAFVEIADESGTIVCTIAVKSRRSRR